MSWNVKVTEFLAITYQSKGVEVSCFCVEEVALFETVGLGLRNSSVRHGIERCSPRLQCGMQQGARYKCSLLRVVCLQFGS